MHFWSLREPAWKDRSLCSSPAKAMQASVVPAPMQLIWLAAAFLCKLGIAETVLTKPAGEAQRCVAIAFVPAPTIPYAVPAATGGGRLDPQSFLEQHCNPVEADHAFAVRLVQWHGALQRWSWQLQARSLSVRELVVYSGAANLLLWALTSQLSAAGDA